jgi:hypothetical protein
MSQNRTNNQPLSSTIFVSHASTQSRRMRSTVTFWIWWRKGNSQLCKSLHKKAKNFLVDFVLCCIARSHLYLRIYSAGPSEKNFCGRKCYHCYHTD